MGSVRAIVWHHLWEVGRRAGVPPPQDDATGLVPALDFAHALAQHGDAHAQREAGRAYAALWGRTFRTLVQHLHGHPERMVLVFVEEFYPYLRGQRLAARVERIGRHRARVIVDDDVPLPYLAGLLEGFVGLSGSPATVNAGPGMLEVRFTVTARDRARRLARHLARLRIPLLLMAALAACLGAAAGSVAGAVPASVVAAVVVGAPAAQSAANAWQDLRSGPPPHPLASPRLGPRWLWFQCLGSAAVALSALTVVASHHAGALAFAVVGALVASGYGRLQARGLGPATAWLVYGLLIPLGTLVGMHGPAILATPGPVFLVTLPTGLLAAAILHLDDLADRPLDEAAGRRTLVVRQVEQQRARTFAILVVGGTLAALAIGVLLRSWWSIGLAALAAFALTVAREVSGRADDPRRLGQTRLPALALYVLTATLLTLTLLETP